MTQLDTILIAAIVALSAVVPFLYFDGRKDRKAHTKSLAERDDRFSSVIKEVVSLHQKQEDEMHLRHEKSTTELVDDHRKELAGMVDRVIEASKNDREHDREDRGRLLALAEALERRAQSGRGRG